MAQPEQHATSFRTEGGIEWYVLTCWRPDSFDITLTNGEGAWQSTDVVYPGGNLSRDMWWAKAKAALQQPSAASGITHSVRLLDGEGVRTSPAELKWSWRHNGVPLKSTVSLKATAQPTEAISSMLGTCIASYRVLRGRVTELVGQCEQLTQDLQKRQGEVAQARQEASGRESDLYLKFSILLNQKKQQLRQLKSDLDAANQALQEGRGSGEQEATSQETGGGGYSGGVYSASTQQDDSAASGPPLEVDSTAGAGELAGPSSSSMRRRESGAAASPYSRQRPKQQEDKAAVQQVSGAALDPMEQATQPLDVPLPTVPGRGSSRRLPAASAAGGMAASSETQARSSPAAAAVTAPPHAAATNGVGVLAQAAVAHGAGAAGGGAGATATAEAPGDNWELVTELAMAAADVPQPAAEPAAGGRARAKRPRR